MFSKSLKKEVARFLVCVMMLTNISPAFTMESRSDYEVVVRQNFGTTSQTSQSLLQIEAFNAGLNISYKDIIHDYQIPLKRS